LELVSTQNFTPTLGEVFTVLHNQGSGPIQGTWANLSEGQTLRVSGYQFQISYVGGTDHQDVTLTVTQVPATTTALTSSADPSVFGQAVTFTATVSAVTPGLPTPQGSVDFVDTTTNTDLGKVQLSGGSATLTTAALAVGGHAITATYSGGGNFLGSSGSLTQTVNQDATTTTLASSADPSVFGQAVTFTATLTANTPGSGTPTGTVTFYYDQIDAQHQIGQAKTLSNGQATSDPIRTLSVSATGHTIYAVYAGDSNFTASQGTQTQTVTGTTQTSSIQANFNGTPISAGSDIWFSSVLKMSGLGSSPVTIGFQNATISFTANGTNYTLAVPNAFITFDPHATSATTSFDPSTTTWFTTLPSTGLSGNQFLDGLVFPVLSNLPGGIHNVTWQGTFMSGATGLSAQWKWGAAVYPSSHFSSDYNALGVKPVDDNTGSQYQNSDHAGTPENYKSYVTGGATGGGGSNYTGSYSGTANSGAFQLAAGATATYVSSTSNQILHSVLTVAVQDDTGAGLDANELADLNTAMAYLNDALGSFGVDLSWAAPGAAADVHIHFAGSTPQGGASAGVLGFTTADNDVYLVKGWNFYTGADASQIGANQFDFLTLATHELAHTVGLGESSDPASVLYEYLAPGAVRRTFTAGDLSAINTEADHFQEVPAAGGMGQGMGVVSESGATDLRFTQVGRNAGGPLVIGGSGDNLLAGSMIDDPNVAALGALLSAWDTATLSDTQRVAALLSGVSSTDGIGTHTAGLDAGSTVSQPAGSGPGTLTDGSSGQDWFFAVVTDGIKDNKNDEIVSTL
jgi:hypothetical protein